MIDGILWGHKPLISGVVMVVTLIYLILACLTIGGSQMIVSQNIVSVIWMCAQEHPILPVREGSLYIFWRCKLFHMLLKASLISDNGVCMISGDNETSMSMLTDSSLAAYLLCTFTPHKTKIYKHRLQFGSWFSYHVSCVSEWELFGRHIRHVSLDKMSYVPHRHYNLLLVSWLSWYPVRSWASPDIYDLKQEELKQQREAHLSETYLMIGEPDNAMLNTYVPEHVSYLG